MYRRFDAADNTGVCVCVCVCLISIVRARAESEEGVTQERSDFDSMMKTLTDTHEQLQSVRGRPIWCHSVEDSGCDEFRGRPRVKQFQWPIQGAANLAIVKSTNINTYCLVRGTVNWRQLSF